MNKNTTIANTVTIGGIGICLLIAQLPLLPSVAILGTTIVGCGYLTKNEK